MVPFYSADGSLVRITENNIPVNYTVQTIKGIKYGIFPAGTKTYMAVYSGNSFLTSAEKRK